MRPPRGFWWITSTPEEPRHNRHYSKKQEAKIRFWTTVVLVFIGILLFLEVVFGIFSQPFQV